MPLQFPFLLKETDKRQMAAQNRNEGVSFVPSNYEILSFFDSDDIMHPQRIELLEWCFREHPTVDVVVHTAQTGPLDMSGSVAWESIQTPPRVYVDTAVTKYELVKGLFTMEPFGLHRVVFGEEFPNPYNGHCTVRRACFTEIQFRETAYGYEDTLFLSELCKRGYVFLALDEMLHYYSLSDRNTVVEKCMNFVRAFGDTKKSAFPLDDTIAKTRAELDRITRVREELEGLHAMKERLEQKLAESSARLQEAKRLLEDLSGTQIVQSSPRI
jgi:hypothetical protein